LRKLRETDSRQFGGLRFLRAGDGRRSSGWIYRSAGYGELCRGAAASAKRPVPRNFFFPLDSGSARARASDPHGRSALNALSQMVVLLAGLQLKKSLRDSVNRGNAVRSSEIFNITSLASPFGTFAIDGKLCGFWVRTRKFVA
jgi:hypothetical protein